ncbi:MAG TPA: class I SAM-dependent RNA methyltransferase [Candidatus Cloacimonadota bacterium]|nr:class I SAM-dependent RNA methyltransferase [Candidatus Cloacimonadota bacterium]
MKPFELFAVVQPGLEKYAIEEFQGLGIKYNEVENGGISFVGHLTTLFKVNIQARCISRVLLRIGKFHADTFWQLEKGLAKLPWDDFISIQDICIRSTSIASNLYHEKAITERCINTLNQHYGKPIRVQSSPDALNTQLILIQVEHDQVTVSIDSSGAHLHKRGYMKMRSPAPIRETIAAGLIKASGWMESDRELLDPMCGSGTIPIEAAVMACNFPLSQYRNFAFQKWGIFNKDLFKRVNDEAGEQIHPMKKGLIHASDISEEMVKIAIQNAKAARVEEYIDFSVLPAHKWHKPLARYQVITNPPYGKRISNQTRISLQQIFEAMQANGSIVDLFIPLEEVGKWYIRKLHFSCKNGGIPIQAIRI